MPNKLIKDSLLSLSRKKKQSLTCLIDFLSICFSIIFAFSVADLSFNTLNILESLKLIWIPFLSICIFWLLGVYKSVVRFIDLSVIFLLVKAMLFAFIANLLINIFYVNFLDSLSNEALISFEKCVISLMSSVILIIGSRLLANFFLSKKFTTKRVVIYGAGSAGIQLAGALRVSSEMQPIAFIDNNFSLHNTLLGGIKVLPPEQLKNLFFGKRIDEVLIAIPSASKSTLRKLLREIEEYTTKVRILPGLAALAEGKVSVSELKEVNIADLLGRLEVEANQDLIDSNIKGKVVLITGAGGSIGSEIARQVANQDAKSIIILDSSEYALYAIKKEIESFSSEISLHAVLTNVTNKKKLTEIFKVFKVDTIYHAAAYKHVPLVEENPFEAVFNNVIGTKICVQAAIETKVETFVLISTDKAVRPTNIMGATKRLSEMILQALSAENKGENLTRMTMVRFGNVLGSSGSAIPLFQQQIKEGGPVTVTHPEITRYFMSIPEAAELVIQAGAMGEGGDVFVLDMGEPVKIIELAKRLINLSGMELKDKDNPEGDIEIVFTGLRPGEKLYEELLIGDNISKTPHAQILRAKEDFLLKEELDKFINKLKDAEKLNDVVALKIILEEVVHGFVPEKSNVDVLYLQKKYYSEE